MAEKRNASMVVIVQQTGMQNRIQIWTACAQALHSTCKCICDHVLINVRFLNADDILKSNRYHFLRCSLKEGLFSLEQLRHFPRNTGWCSVSTLLALLPPWSFSDLQRHLCPCLVIVVVLTGCPRDYHILTFTLAWEVIVGKVWVLFAFCTLSFIYLIQ